MTYLRYLIVDSTDSNFSASLNPIQQAAANAGGIVGGLVNAGVDRLTGNDLLGDIAGGVARGFINSRF